MKKYLPQQKGFVILFTILISVIILMIGLGIFSIATRETVLSGTAREAQYAFYAADAGVECALYADSLGVFDSQGNGGTFPCGALQPNAIGPNTFTFNMLVDATGKTCAHVTVINSSGSRHVISQGYNICNVTATDATPATKNPLLVERDLDTVYAVGATAGGTGTGSGTTGGGTSGGVLTPPPVLPATPQILLNTTLQNTVNIQKTLPPSGQ